MYIMVVRGLNNSLDFQHSGTVSSPKTSKPSFTGESRPKKGGEMNRCTRKYFFGEIEKIQERRIKMGWTSGSDLMADIINSLKRHLPNNPKLRQKIYVDLIVAFEDSDWDTQDDCYGQDPAFDLALKGIHPDDWNLE